MKNARSSDIADMARSRIKRARKLLDTYTVEKNREAIRVYIEAMECVVTAAEEATEKWWRFIDSFKSVREEDTEIMQEKLNATVHYVERGVER